MILSFNGSQTFENDLMNIIHTQMGPHFDGCIIYSVYTLHIIQSWL